MERYIQIPKKFRGIETDRTDKLDKYWKENLFITGDVGVGKSVFAANIAKKILDSGELKETPDGFIDSRVGVKWINYTKFVIQLKGGFNGRFSDDLSPWEIAEKIAAFKGVLFIDDLGVEKNTDFVKEITYFIINEREANEKDLIITSNLGLEDLEQRVASRIAGMCKIIRLKGKDRRING